MAVTSESGRRSDVVVVGAGPAGLATSRHLSMLGVGHVVLERDEVGATWRSERWDSFHLVTPAWSVRLPGLDLSAHDPDEFLSRTDIIHMLDRYARLTKAPVRTHVEVRAVRRDGDSFVLMTSEGEWSARAVVVASGPLRLPRVPAIALPTGVAGVHAIDYRRPDQLAPGAVLVVGSGQSGVQIADELRRAGRTVFLATSAVGRVPRRYRGRDVFVWLRELGLLEQSREKTPEEVRRAPQVAVSGSGGGRTMALQQLARDGITLLGKLVGADGARFRLAGDLAHNMKAADDFAARFRAQIDRHLGAETPGDVDPVEAPLGYEPASPTELDAATAGIGSVVWCTGMRPDTGWLPADVVDPSGTPEQHDGALALPGLFVVGLPWQTHRGSGILYGMATDAADVASQISNYLG
ncbi:NAD(P)-binding domain-containing protein [Actinoplanes solisilvae]|uniref:NAD(P)-binding domain-containing protein n=1 Tax=Actinoplanes solisilvae TaxID=2486853 RepID=UPI000FDAA882|nr:NAD(P)-binding domain-containing protein [Actinoplanes solisilvae]